MENYLNRDRRDGPKSDYDLNENGRKNEIVLRVCELN